MKQYTVEGITPDMKGGINFWSKKLGMGAANIRTAIRAKSLNAELVVLNPEGNQDLKGYQITGQDILTWRASQRHVGTGERTVRSTTHFVFKTSAKITTEQAEAANAALAAAGLDIMLVKPAIAGKKVKAVKVDETDIPMPVVDILTDDAKARLDALSATDGVEEPVEEPVAETPRGFGFGRKHK